MISQGKQIKLGAVLSYTGIFLGILSGLVYNPWMIRQIGDADYGLYTLAMSLINMFLIDLGLDMAAQRYVSKYRAEQDQQKVDDIIGLIYQVYLFITAVLAAVFVALYFFVDGIYVKLTPAEMEKFKALYIMAAAYTVTSFPFIPLSGILRSYEKFIQVKTVDLVHKILIVVLTAAALFAGVGVYALVVVHLIASVAVIAMRLIFIKRCTPVKANFSYRDLAKVKELFGFSIWSSVYDVVMRSFLAIAPSILGVVSGSAEIAVFGYAVSIEGHIFSFVNGIKGFFMPQLSRIDVDENDENKSEHVLSLMVTVGRFILILFGLIFVGFAVLGQDFITLLVGAEYRNAYYCVLLICGYGLIAYPQQIANTYTIVQNKVKERAINSLIAFGVYLLLVFFFGKWWGEIGISVAIGIALVLQTILMNILYVKKLHIRIGEFFKVCHLKLLPGFAVFAVIAFGLSRIPLSGWTGFAVKVLLIVAVYAVLVWTVFLNASEKKMLFGRFLKKR